jgi:hypothetical protein
MRIRVAAQSAAGAGSAVGAPALTFETNADAAQVVLHEAVRALRLRMRKS